MMYICMYIYVSGGTQVLSFTEVKIVLSFILLSIEWIKAIHKPFLIIMSMQSLREGWYR